jgi:hypothetical protein
MLLREAALVRVQPVPQPEAADKGVEQRTRVQAIIPEAGEGEMPVYKQDHAINVANQDILLINALMDKK